MGALTKLIGSKRFMAAIAAMAVLIVVKYLGLKEDAATEVVDTAMKLALALIASYTATDVVLAVKNKKKE